MTHNAQSNLYLKSVLFEIGNPPDGMAPEAIAAQTQRHSCYSCGAELLEYSEEHHMNPLGMGGSDERDIPSNKVRLCFTCHNRIQPRMGKIEPSLRLYRGDDGLIHKEERIDGEWIETVPYGRLITSRHLGTVLHSSQSFNEFLILLHNQMDRWDDEALRTEYETLHNAGTIVFATQCMIIHILATRRRNVDGKTDQKIGLKAAAQFLGISYYTARLRHAIWGSILSKVPNGRYWNGLSADYFYAAYNARSRGVDPVEALDHAEVQVEADRSYSPSRFRRELEHGLPVTSEEELAWIDCPRGCKHGQRAGPDAWLTILVHNEIVAEGQAEGTWYCKHRRCLISSLSHDGTCEFYEARE